MGQARRGNRHTKRGKILHRRKGQRRKSQLAQQGLGCRSMAEDKNLSVAPDAP